MTAGPGGSQSGGSDPSVTPAGHGELEPEPDSAAALFGDGILLARRYANMLASDGILRGLIGPHEAGRMWSRHILNSAVAASQLPEGATVTDIGSGAGLPGIPLAILRPDCRFALVEPLQRRTDFLLAVVAELALANCRVVRGRAQDVLEQAGQVDVATSRAVAPLAKLAAWSAPLLVPGGKMLALKGSSAHEELERDSVGLARCGLVDLRVLTLGAGVVVTPTFAVCGVKRRSSGTSTSRPAAGQARQQAGHRFT